MLSLRGLGWLDHAQILSFGQFFVVAGLAEVVIEVTVAVHGRVLRHGLFAKVTVKVGVESLESFGSLGSLTSLETFGFRQMANTQTKMGLLAWVTTKCCSVILQQVKSAGSLLAQKSVKLQV